MVNQPRVAVRLGDSTTQKVGITFMRLDKRSGIRLVTKQKVFYAGHLNEIDFKIKFTN